MKALIFPFQCAEALRPLRSLCPDFLLPLVGKPVTEHILEQLVTTGIRDVTLLCDDRPEEVVRHFGNGERWGCSLTMSSLRGEGGLKRMSIAALQGIEGLVVCLAGNLTVSDELTRFLASSSSPVEGQVVQPVFGDYALAADAVALLALMEETSFENMTELTVAAHMKGFCSKSVDSAHRLLLITAPTEYLQIQRDILEEQYSGSRIPANSAGNGVWIGDHTRIENSIRLVAPVLIGSHCRISGAGQIGPNAVISSYCLVNNTDLICDSFVMSGTVTGPHTELNGMAARGGSLVNLRSGATVIAPDPFILGRVGFKEGQGGRKLFYKFFAAMLLLLLLPVGFPLLLLSLFAPGLLRSEQLLGNRRLKTLTGDNPRKSFMLREFSWGPLLLRRWPGLLAVLQGDLLLVGALPLSPQNIEQGENDLPFGIDAAKGLFHIWEVEGDPPESIEERQVRENFHSVSCSMVSDLSIVMKTAIIIPRS